jgi:hypothetical protein
MTYESRSKPRRTRQETIVTGIGGVVGIALVILNVVVVGEYIGRGTPVFAMNVAVLYVLFGTVTLIAGAFPRVGAMSDDEEDDIREHRTLYLINGGLFIAAGAFLGALTLGYGETPVLGATAAAAIAIVSALVAIALNIFTYRMIDELILSITKDATLVATSIMLLLFGGWAAAAILGAAPMFSPLLALSGFFAIYLASNLTIAHRRGLLT